MNLWGRIRIITPAIISNVIRQDIIKKPLYKCLRRNLNITSKIVILPKSTNITSTVMRWKSKKHQYDSDDEVAFDEDTSLSKDSKLVKFSSTSMRTDIILKFALGVSRNKIEQLFYESKIRINGKKILKKSASVKLGDEVDVIKMVSPNNSDHLYVARVEILNVVPKEDSIQISARRFKNLLIENYDNDPHKSGAQEN